MKRAAERIVGLGAAAVLVKGGHLPGDRLTDVLLTADGFELFEDSRIATRHTHGTGCTLASAIAAGLAQGLPLIRSVERARAYVRKAIETAPGLGSGHGPLNHGHTVERFLSAIGGFRSPPASSHCPGRGRAASGAHRRGWLGPTPLSGTRVRSEEHTSEL